jgi:hypothetical protein
MMGFHALEYSNNALKSKAIADELPNEIEVLSVAGSVQ